MIRYIIIILALIAFIESKSCSYVRHKKFKKTNFDYFAFRQIWPPSSCMFPGKNTCKIPENVTTWVVHGLWPSVNSGMSPTFCDESYPFDYNSIKWLVPLLLEFWPNLYTNTPIDSFWKHEWDKHGTCAVSLVKNESGYFNVSLALRDHFDFGPILKGSNIVPDDTLLYDLNKIKYAIKSVLGVEPLVTCYVLRDSNVQYLSQMQFCLSKQFELIECEIDSINLIKLAIDKTPEETHCQQGLPIHYPTFHYSKLIEELIVPS